MEDLQNSQQTNSNSSPHSARSNEKMEFLQLVGPICFIGFAVILLILAAIIMRRGEKYPVIQRFESEKYYKDPVSKKRLLFPSLEDRPTVNLSVIIPAYYEQERLPPMLDECFAYLKKKFLEDKKFTYEVIVVNDGSTDGTASLAFTYVKKYGVQKVRLLNLIKNRGKGGAVRLGVQSSRGSLILFADADGATKFSDLDKLFDSLNEMVAKEDFKDDLWKFSGIVCGSRAHMEQDAIATRSFFRTILMHGFHLLVETFTVKEIRDTQCGFKLFTRTAARTCFSNLHIERWAFDVELLYIAQFLKIPIAEVAVNWIEIDGSKVTPIWSWLQMGRDLVLIWLRYEIGAWKLKTKSK